MAAEEALYLRPILQNRVTLIDAQAPEPADVNDIRLIRGGNVDAYSRIIARYQDVIGAYMWRFTRNPAECEALVHDVFVQAYFSLPTFRGEAPLLHWLRKVATRVGYRFWKARARERNRHEVHASQDSWRAPADDRDIRIWQREVLDAALALIPPRDRVVLVLTYIEELSTREAAAALGWSHALVRVQAFRARRKLKIALSKVMGNDRYA